MFKENFVRLCNQRGVAPTSVCTAIGLQKSAFSNWDETSVPRQSTLIKIADYFGVSVDYLLGKEQKEKPAATEDDELVEYLEELKNRPEMRMLFSLAKGATKEDVERAVAIIEALRKNSDE